MTEIIINGPDDFDVILERLNDMPMTRKYGKGLVARIPTGNVDKPTAIYIRVSSSHQAAEGKGSLVEQFNAVWKDAIKRGGHPVSVYADVCTASNRNRKAFNILIDDL